MKTIINGITVICLLASVASCISTYEPSASTDDNDPLLVVEGIITDSESAYIQISQTRTLTQNADRFYVSDFYPASVEGIIRCSDGTDIQLQRAKDTAGVVTMRPVQTIRLAPEQTYTLELRIDGKSYITDPIAPMQTPEIDDVSFEYIAGSEGVRGDEEFIEPSVQFYLSTHDPDQGTEYYLWKYDENWEVRVQYYTTLRYDPVTKQIFDDMTLETSHNTYYCWAKDYSKGYVLGNATQQAGGRIVNAPLYRVSRTMYDSRFSYLYCLTAKQYAISKEAYLYFENVRKNSESTGGLFSPIPVEMDGNIHCVTNPEERIIGYIIAADESIKRVFINMEDTPDMIYHPEDCTEIPQALENRYPYGLGVWKKGDLGGSAYDFTDRRCVDCFVHNNANKDKPPFWPNDHK